MLPHAMLMKFFKMHGLIVAIDLNTDDIIKPFQNPADVRPCTSGVAIYNDYGNIGSWKNNFSWEN